MPQLPRTTRVITDQPGFVVAVAIEFEHRSEVWAWTSVLVRETDEMFAPVRAELARIGAKAPIEDETHDDKHMWFGKARATKYVAPK